MTARPRKPKRAAKATYLHDWWVYSTAVGTGALMLECRHTGWRGVVRNPTREEWNTAFYAPSKPYRWTEHDRVEVVL